MLLQNGITGFSETMVQLTPINKEKFKDICYEIVNSLKFKVQEFDFNLSGRNFYYAKVEFDGDILFVLINAYYSVISFASEISPFNNRYINIWSLEEKFSNFYRVIGLPDLDSQISSEERKCLNKVELKQLGYYKPNNIGEVIFNYWD